MKHIATVQGRWPSRLRRLRGNGLGGTQHLRAGAGRKMLSRDIRGYFQTIRKQLVVLQTGQTALIAKATEYLPQRVSVCAFSSPCPPFPGVFPHPRTPSKFVFAMSVSLQDPDLLARQKIPFQIRSLPGADLSGFLSLSNCLYFPAAGGNWTTVIFKPFSEEQAPQKHFWRFTGKKPPRPFGVGD